MEVPNAENEKEGPLLSIVVLCYNHEDFLDEALYSLSHLSAQLAEVIICDDASSDSSPQKLSAWQKKRPDWQFFFHKENIGNCQTFNQLLPHCRGRWILDFASDDILVPEALEGWLAFAESNPEIGFCYADALVFNTKQAHRFLGNKPGQIRPEGKILESLFGQPFICPPAVLFSKKALQSVGGYNGTLAYEDWDVWLRIARYFSVACYTEVVIKYRKHAASLSASLLQQRNERLLVSTYKILSEVIDWPELSPKPSIWLPFIRYHLRLSCYLQLPARAQSFFHLLKIKSRSNFIDRMWVFAANKLPFLPFLYRIYRQKRGGLSI